MGLLEDVQNEMSGRMAGPCKVHALLPRLDEVDGAQLLELLADASVPISAIERALINRGTPISDSTLSRWRKHGCPCGAS